MGSDRRSAACFETYNSGLDHDPSHPCAHHPMQPHHGIAAAGTDAWTAALARADARAAARPADLALHAL